MLDRYLHLCVSTDMQIHTPHQVARMMQVSPSFELPTTSSQSCFFHIAITLVPSPVHTVVDSCRFQCCLCTCAYLGVHVRLASKYYLSSHSGFSDDFWHIFRNNRLVCTAMCVYSHDLHPCATLKSVDFVHPIGVQ